MRSTILGLTLSFLVTPSAIWAIPIDNLPDFLRPVDLVVMGQLSDVREHVTDAYIVGGGSTEKHYGSAILRIDLVIWGTPPSMQPLELEWSSPAHLDSGTWREHTEGERGVYFITCPEILPPPTSSMLRCDIQNDLPVREYFYLPAEQLKTAEELLLKYPLRMYFPRGGSATPSSTIVTVISLVNFGSKTLTLPGFSYRDGIFYHAKGVELTMHSDAPDQQTVASHPERIRLANQADIRLAPGQEFSIEIDLNTLFDLSTSGWYTVQIGFIGYPPQLRYSAVVLGPEGFLGSQKEKSQ